MFLNKYMFLIFFVLFNTASFAESSLDSQQFSKTQKIVSKCIYSRAYSP